MVIDLKKYIFIILGIIVVLTIAVIVLVNNGKHEYLVYEYKTYNESGEIENNTLEYYETKKVTNYVKIDTSKGIIMVELYPDVAPKTVSNFKSLVKNNFYKNMIFHRVIKDFMIQTGDPTGTGSGGSSRTIKGEFSSNGIENNLSHTRGVVSMARSNANDSASSQFFIVQKDSTYLDGNYAAFGNVIAGMEVVDKIATVMTDSNDKPISEIKLNSITFINIK
ncbi:MAG: peptidylprolyl isomerase [Bacilli bacterium]|nr:peptidylprolyl isomerase [Bacilli bacterium]